MNDINPLYIFIPVWILIASLFLIMLLRVRKQLPNLKKGRVQFHETGASGYSNKSFVTKAGGASGVLRISIIDNTVHFWASLAFAVFGKMYDLLHNIPVNDIIEMREEKRKVVVRFYSKGQEKEFVIRDMKNKDEFISLINQLKSKR